MPQAMRSILALLRAGLVLAQHGVRLVPKGMPPPLPLRLAHIATAPLRWLSAPFRIGQPKDRRISGALGRLGPSYIKLGQFLGTRGDIVGPEVSADLRHL
ncbi:MAG TPA: ubiquinone biosynthesis protein UbiB, partial [Hyphomicrobiaceae bacterium]|nr:ubiquinone biosynthesis protein UbiB [Hyphomicrobiaceae bacterium]